MQDLAGNVEKGSGVSQLFPAPEHRWNRSGHLRSSFTVFAKTLIKVKAGKNERILALVVERVLSRGARYQQSWSVLMV